MKTAIKFDWASRVDYKPDRKAAFHRQAKAHLRKLADLLDLAPGSYDLRSNEGGIAVSGEITLHTETMYVQVSQSCIGVGMGILIRRCKGRKDYTGGQNHWLALGSLDNLPSLATFIKKVEGIG